MTEVGSWGKAVVLLAGIGGLVCCSCEGSAVVDHGSAGHGGVSTSTSSSSASSGTTTTTTTTTSSSTSSSTSTTGTGGGNGLTCAEDVTNVTGECDLLTQNCPPGHTCDKGADGYEAQCVPVTGTAGIYEGCTTVADCAEGLTCATIGGYCTPFCCPGTTEPCAGGICSVTDANVDMFYAMVCANWPQCTLFQGDCGSNKPCHIHNVTSPLTICGWGSPNTEGQPCTYVHDCGDAAFCNDQSPDTGICRHLCDVATWQQAAPAEGDCLPNRSYVDMSWPAHPGIGLCLPP